MRDVRVGLALFPHESLRVAVLPLFEEGVVDAIEWTVDNGWQDTPVPAWAAMLLGAFADERRLYGHGVRYSPTSAYPGGPSEAWLAALERETAHRAYQHVTEHWGFSRAGRLVSGAPLPLVACQAVVEVTTRALRELAKTARVPVGLENLALAFHDADVDAQPEMLARVLDAVDGVLLFDVHNVFCQAVNFGRDARELCARYPLERVRELHVAGGGWSSPEHGPDRRPFRRDTHDAPAPHEVMELVQWLVPRCPALEVVVLERLPHTLVEEVARDAWRTEWLALSEVVKRAAAEPVIVADARARPRIELDPAPSETALATQQRALIDALTLESSPHDVLTRLLQDGALSPFHGQITRFEPRAIEVAMSLVRTWGVFEGG